MPLHETRVGKIVDVMHRANEGGDQALLLKGRKRVGADPVMGVIEIEGAVLGAPKPADVIVDALVDHVGGVTLRGFDRERNGGTTGLAKEAAPRGVRRVQHSLDAEVFEGLAEVHRMDDAAARKGGVRQHGDAKRAAHAARAPAPNPISRSSPKSRRRALRPFRLQHDLASRFDDADRSRVQPARAKQRKHGLDISRRDGQEKADSSERS